MVLSRTRIVAFLVLTVVLVFGLWCAYGLLAVAGIETPHYNVATKQNGYEIREYDPMILATTTVDGSLDAATTEGFKRIAGYIFGGNAVHENIAMTAPVTTEMASQSQDGATGAYSISFILPAQYSMSDLPLPSDASVRVKSVPAQTIAVLSFYGSASESTVDAKMSAFSDLLEKDGFTASGAMTLAQYNPPFTPWFLRRNEIWATVLQVR